MDFLGALTLDPAQDIVPETVILGIDPEDIKSLSLELTAATQSRVDLMIDMVLDALTRFGGSCWKKAANYRRPDREAVKDRIQLKPSLVSLRICRIAALDLFFSHPCSNGSQISPGLLL